MRHEKEVGPSDAIAEADQPEHHPCIRTAEYIDGLRRRRAATYRVPPYRDTCSCADPWTCRCDEAVQPSERMVDAYRDAANSLLTVGLTPAAFVPEMRQLWRRDAEQRKLARLIAERWQVAVA